MKKRLLFCLAVAAMLMLTLCGAAMAEDDPITLYMDLSADRFSGPAEVTVSIKVTNSSDTDMPGSLALYYPDGKQVEDFGTPTLAAGSSVSWVGTWMVTQEQLAEGKLTFAVRYPIRTADGMLVDKQKNFYRPIVDAGAVAQVEVNRTITPTMARKGQEVSVIYEIINVGTIDVTDVVIKESSAVSKTNGTIATVKAGEKATYTFTVTMGTKNLTSNGTITYKANGKSSTVTVDDATIKYGDVKLTATLKADKKGGNPGETMKLTLTLKNTGKVDYENITVTDAQLGTVFTGLVVKAGETVTQEKEITITNTAEYQFTVSGADASGATVETATGRVAVTAVDPTKDVTLNVEASVDNSTIYMLPGIVKFTVNVTNVSGVDAKDVTVSATGVDLYTFDSIQPGQTRSFVRDVRIDTPGKFRFDARVLNQLEESVTFESNVISIIHSAPTATPSQVPLATPPLPDYEDMPTKDNLPPYIDTVEQVLGIAKWVLLALAGVGVALIVVSIAGRSAQAAKSKKAEDHLELDGYRDYTQAVHPKHRHVMPENEAAEDEPVARPVGADVAPEDIPEVQEDDAAIAEEGAIMEETLGQLYPRARAEESGEEETFRRRRRADEE
ncbi:MAG: hypothetical protein IJ438_06380 [Clostridia bacterium]|nr:hypothetical protein [Clostridia bacterium]